MGLGFVVASRVEDLVVDRILGVVAVEWFPDIRLYLVGVVSCLVLL